MRERIKLTLLVVLTVWLVLVCAHYWITLDRLNLAENRLNLTERRAELAEQRAMDAEMRTHRLEIERDDTELELRQTWRVLDGLRGGDLDAIDPDIVRPTQGWVPHSP